MEVRDPEKLLIIRFLLNSMIGRKFMVKQSLIKTPVFHKLYSVYDGKTDTITFNCSKCGSKISEVITFPAANGGNNEEIICSECDARYDANIFSNEVGGYIDVYVK